MNEEKLQEQVEPNETVEEVQEPTPPTEESELEKLQAEVTQFKDLAARSQAELINYKARAEREYARLRALGASRAVLALLPVLDNLDLALQSEGDLRDGVRITKDQFVAALAGLSVEILDPLGEVFNPAEHEAMGLVPVDQQDQDGKVVLVFQKGYRMSGQVIRAAKVHVGQFQKVKTESDKVDS